MSPITSQFLDSIHWIVFNLFFRCVTVNLWELTTGKYGKGTNSRTFNWQLKSVVRFTNSGHTKGLSPGYSLAIHWNTGSLLTLWHFFFMGTVVTGMEEKQIIESLANYIWFLRVANAVCISHLLLIDRRTSVDLWRHKFEFLVTFNLEKSIIFVNSIKKIRDRTFLEITTKTTIGNYLTANVSVKCIEYFAIHISLKLTDYISLISIFRNVQQQQHLFIPQRKKKVIH